MFDDALSSWKSALQFIRDFSAIVVPFCTIAINYLLSRYQRMADAQEEQRKADRAEEREHQKKLEDRLRKLEEDESFKRGLLEAEENKRRID